MHAPTPHGRLAVRAGCLIGLGHQRPVTLSGVSLFWSQWMGAFYDERTVAWFATEWQATLVRAAVGVHESSGYLFEPQAELAKAERVLDAAIARGVYCIVDWHDHHAEQHAEQACAFFGALARRYGRHENLIYEIFNEPHPGVPWPAVRAYAERVIAAIRQHDPVNLIIVGTPCWSQQVDVAAAAPLDDANVARAQHSPLTTRPGPEHDPLTRSRWPTRCTSTRARTAPSCGSAPSTRSPRARASS